MMSCMVLRKKSKVLIPNLICWRLHNFTRTHTRLHNYVRICTHIPICPCWIIHYHSVLSILRNLITIFVHYDWEGSIGKDKWYVVVRFYHQRLINFIMNSTTESHVNFCPDIITVSKVAQTFSLTVKIHIRFQTRSYDKYLKVYVWNIFTGLFWVTIFPGGP